MTKARLSIVIGTYNRRILLQNCIRSIRMNGITLPYEIIVIDGGSNDGTEKWLVRQRDILTICQHNRYEENGKIVIKKAGDTL